MKHKDFYGWKVCFGCALLLFCTSGLSINAFNVYQPYLISCNGFSNTQSSMIITFRSLSTFVSMFLCGIYYKKLRLRTGMCLAGLMLVLAFVLFGVANQYYVFLIAGIIMGFSYGFGTMIPIQMVLQKWFIEKRSFAISICWAATGLSTLGIPTLLTQSIERLGLKETFLLEAIVILIIITVSTILIKDDPSKMKQTALGQSKTESKQSKIQKVSLKKKDYLLLGIMLVLLGAQTSVAYSHLSVLFKSQGYDSYTIATVIMVSGLSMTGAKILFGYLSKKISIVNRNYLFGIMLISGDILLCLCKNNLAVLYSGAILFSAGLSLTTVGRSEWEGDFSSEDQYANMVRFSNIGYAAGSFVFSALPGILADIFDGCYVPSFIFFTGCGLFILFSVQWIYRNRPISL